ncbi:hypothetical protein SXCC_02828 [Gluconacetobacter sp. SXCC-1]|nr:hypothetical protein SXCC_02828 [Gluconacetobacter sp. SXCC-1]
MDNIRGDVRCGTEPAKTVLAEGGATHHMEAGTCDRMQDAGGWLA